VQEVRTNERLHLQDGRYDDMFAYIVNDENKHLHVVSPF